MTNPLLLSFYGDDLTGSTDAMEALTLAGVRTALFLQPATAAQLARLSQSGELQAIGLAGTSRSETPAWMDAHLPPALGWLRSLGAPIATTRFVPLSTAHRKSATSAVRWRSACACSNSR